MNYNNRLNATGTQPTSSTWNGQCSVKVRSLLETSFTGTLRKAFNVVHDHVKDLEKRMGTINDSDSLLCVRDNGCHRKNSGNLKYHTFARTKLA